MATVIDDITQSISTIPPLRLTETVINLPADEDDFVAKYEANNAHLVNNLVPELNTLKTQINNITGQINTVAGEVTTAESSISPHYTAIEAVVLNATNIDAVATNETNINNVSTNMPKITNVDTNMSDINLVADSIVGGTLPTIIDDTTPSTLKTYSSSKIESKISTAVGNITTDTEAVQDIIGSSVVAGSNISVSYNDTTGKTNIAFSGSIAGGFTNMQVFTTSQTFNIASAKGAGVYYVECVGGGGGGGNATGTYSKASGGGGGGGVRAFVYLSSNVTVTIGGGGAGGSAGGTTTFGTFCTSNGGGAGSLYTNMSVNHTGGAGGTSSVNSVVSSILINGKIGASVIATNDGQHAVSGGDSPFISSSGASSKTGTTADGAGDQSGFNGIYGGGGGGSSTDGNGSFTSSGGAGGSGYVIIMW